MKKLFLIIIVLINLNYYQVFSQGNTCQQATPFCTAIGTPFVYPNVANGSTAQAGPYYDCLLQTPNPSWFYVKTSSAGVMTFSLSQTVNANGTGGGIDVDFICWGPFSSPSNCGNLTFGMVEDCSFDPASTETMTINSPAAGLYYIILITNYSGITSPPGTPGYIAITQTGGPSTDCSITCPPNNFTLVGTNYNTNANIPNNSTVSCSDPFILRPPSISPFTNPYSDILTPCIKTSFSPFTANISTNGSLNAYEGGSLAWAPYCPSTCGSTIGGSIATPGNDYFIYFQDADPAQQHDFVFCKGAGAIGTTTITLENCWDNTIIAGPTVWNAASPTCFTLTSPANTSIGTASFAIAPATGSVGIVDFNWGLLYVDPSYLPAGQTYTVTYTFQGPSNCAPVNGYYVFTVPATPVVTAVSSKTACSGSTVPATNFTTTPSGGSINWSNSNTAIGVAASGTSNIASYTAPTVTASTTGVFTVTATQNGCNSAAQTFSITIHPRPTPSITATNSICLGSSVTFTGSGASTYTWSGSSGNGLSGSTGTTIGATPTSTGNITYTATVTSAQGCTNTATRVLTVNPIPTANAGPSRVLTCANTSTTLSGSGGGSYAWSGPGIVTGGTSATPTINQPGTYTLIVTSSGCPSLPSVVTVSQNTTAPTAGASNSSTLTCTTRTIGITGTGGGTYAWSGPGIVSGGSTATPSVNLPGTYVVTVTAANGCTATANTSVTQNTTAPTAGASNSSTLTCTTRTIGITGTGGGTYAWSGPGIVSGGSTATPSVNLPGTYVVTVTAANGCTATANTSVTQNTTAPTASAVNSGSLNCTNTTVALTASGGGTYSWTGGAITGNTSANPTVNAGGTYSVLVTAANGCTATANTSVTQNTTAPTAGASNSGSLTCTVNSINLTASGGGTYAWSGPGITGATNTATTTANTPGSYVVVVTAANGCTATANTTINQNTTTPTANAGPSQTLTCGSPSVTLTGSASPTGATANWLGGVCGSSSSFTTAACAPGTYTLVATIPASGCTHTSVVTVSSSTNVPQATVNPVTNSITCTNSIVTIGVTPVGSDPLSFAWSGPGTLGSPTNSVTTANMPGVYSVTITNTSSGCDAIYTANVPSNTIAPVANATSSSTITCTNTVVTLNATPTGTNYAYSWSGPGTITNGTSSSPSVDAGGSYVVTVTDNINGCTATSTVTVISNTTTPSFTLGTAPTLTATCAVPTVTLSGSSSDDPNTIYTWTTPSSGTLTGNPVMVSNPGIYTVSVTNTLTGCSTSSALQATVEVVADAGIPVVTLSSNTASITCTNPSPTVAITTTASPVTYSWSPTAGIVPGTETTATPQFTAPGTYSAVVTNTVSGCVTSIANNVVTVIDATSSPSLNLSSSVNSGTITCTNLNVTVTPTVSPSANVTYTWSGTGLASPPNQASATFTAAGVYTLAVTNTLTGCVTSSTNTANTFTVVVDNTAPTGTITVTSSNTVIGCGASNGTVTLNSSTSGANATNINWLPGNLNTPSIDVTSAGTYTLEVVDAVNGCSTTVQYVVTGSTVTPQGVDAGTSANIACGSSTVVLNGVTTSSNVSYTWTGPSATSILTGSNTLNPTVGETGTYTLTVTDNVTGCSSSAVVTVSQSLATASLTANPTTGASPLDVNFTGGGNGTSFTWDFGNGQTSTDQNPSQTFTTGTYTVSLVVASGTCVATATVEIVVEDGLTLEIPNVFTPNGDNVNDIFTIKSTGVKEIALQIFNRWGEKLYEFSGAKASWDGKVPNGASAPEGTYFFFVKATGFDGKEIEKHGSVNLFR